MVSNKRRHLTYKAPGGYSAKKRSNDYDSDYVGRAQILVNKLPEDDPHRAGLQHTIDQIVAGNPKNVDPISVYNTVNARLLQIKNNEAYIRRD